MELSGQRDRDRSRPSHTARLDLADEPAPVEFPQVALAAEPIELPDSVADKLELLTEEEIWISDRAEDEDGNYVFGNKAGIPHKNRKARRFECWVAALERNGEDWTFKPGLEVWDQGGSAWIDTEEDEPQKIGIKMRNVVWPTGTNRDSLVLYAYKEDDERAVSYAWGEPEATRLAMNLRWMQASCTHTP